ncbi:2-phosphosulfolactate phosphatase [Cryobacterium sp. M23]|uniref:2-phosphosulfolactate phosphatase n=1 Tax=Cryobacterium sp. M23 TaxID=2048292 RepID=UPI000CE34B56|nr:2-phosphosulfolactate phosphatase [Cryobacterium sp. M23]
MNKDAPQQKYQVRFDVGLAGFQALAAEADVVILADALPSPGSEIVLPTALHEHQVIAASLANRASVAEWVLARQAEKGDRFSVAVIAVGEQRQGGAPRFAVEDFLAAGAVIDALAARGIDHCSPEAAAAAAGFAGLARAVRHLVTASETAQALVAEGRSADVQAAVGLEAPATQAPARQAPATDAPARSPGISRLWEFAFPG